MKIKIKESQNNREVPWEFFLTEHTNGSIKLMAEKGGTPYSVLEISPSRRCISRYGCLNGMADTFDLVDSKIKIDT